jgi:hypothetical protein
MIRFAARLNRPYGVSLDLADRHPWESVQRYMREVDRRELYWGALYLSVGETVPSDEARRPARHRGSDGVPG